MSTFKRFAPREPYEIRVVEALVACGYMVHLSSDKEDIVDGFDAVDDEHGLRIDFYLSAPGNSQHRLEQKLIKAANRGIYVLILPEDLIEDICLSVKGALNKLDDLYLQFLETVCPDRVLASA